MDLKSKVTDNLRHKIIIDSLMKEYDDQSQRMNLLNRMKHYGVSGVSLAVIVDGKIDLNESFGHIDFHSKQKVNNETLFQAGSISKTINAIGILLLIQQYKLSLDEDVNNYLKSYAVENNQFTKDYKITLRQLLSHCAGTNVHGFPGYNRLKVLPSTLEILGGKKPEVNTDKIEVIRIPGEKCVYSGGGTIITQMIVEDITRESYQDWMHRNVLLPFNMIHSTFDQTQINYKSNIAAGHLLDSVEVEGRYNLYPEMAAAGLITTAQDIGNFLIKLFEQLGNECREKILQIDLLKEMIVPQIKGFQDDFAGLGVFINGTGRNLRFEHDGMNEGFVARFIAYPEYKSGFVIMVNNEEATGLLNEITASIADIYQFPGFESITKDCKDYDAGKYIDYVGIYQNGDSTIRVSISDNKLYFSRSSPKKFELYLEKDNLFFIKEKLYLTEFSHTEDNIPLIIIHDKDTKINYYKILTN